MYLFIGCLLGIVLICFIIFRFRKKKACDILRKMNDREKCSALNPLIEPLGYRYEPSQDMFTTTIDTPQRAFGYTALYDHYASHFGMILDCLPIYFDYDGRTWLIELWKGQYGIALGCEVGVYKADGRVSSIFRSATLFHAADNEELLPMSIRLCQKDRELSHISGRHWWLTAFHIGAYTEPEDLSVQIGITFPNAEMLDAFVDAIDTQTELAYCTCDLRIQFLFDDCTLCSRSSLARLPYRFVQWQNRMLCRLFLYITKPFVSGIDRILCLYYYLPSAFLRIFRDQKRRKCRRKSYRTFQDMCHENRI